MLGLGKIINTAAIVAGGIFGHVFGRFMTEESQETLCLRLEQLGVTELLLAVFTHADGDHMGGADGVFFFNGLGTDPVYTNLNNKTKMVKWFGLLN